MKRLLRPFWNLTGPIRARVEARLDAIVHAAAARALAAHDLKAHFQKAESQSDEVTLVLDAVVAEQFRLQSQVEDLKRRLDEVLDAADNGWR